MNELTQLAVKVSEPKTWSLWDRPDTPPAYRIQERDVKIIEAVFRHRFLTVSHIHALLGGSKARLGLRCRVLWQDGFLERPKALRPTKVLTDEIVYALGKKGAHYLEHLRKKGLPVLDYLKPDVNLGVLDWAESPKKQIGWPYIDHQLGIASFMVAMQLAVDKAGLKLRWDGHFNRRDHRIITIVPDDKGRPQRVSFLPDAHFIIDVPGKGPYHHFLELDRANVSLSRMRQRYEYYMHYWRHDHAKRDFKYFRVLTVTYDQDYMNSLRRAAQPVGRDNSHPNTWKGLLFTHAGSIDLKRPERLLEPVWRYADDDSAVSLL